MYIVMKFVVLEMNFSPQSSCKFMKMYYKSTHSLSERLTIVMQFVYLIMSRRPTHLPTLRDLLLVGGVQWYNESQL